MKRIAGLCRVQSLALLVATLVVGSHSPGQDPPLDDNASAAAREFLTQHCGECHSGAEPAGRLTLAPERPEFSSAAARRRWDVLIARVEAGTMPPKERPRPAPQTSAQFIQWVRRQLADAEAEARQANGRVVLRRLNRVEYENTLRDLLGVHLNLKDQLPADGSADGFDNAGAALHTSSFLLERYLEAAEIGLNQAIANLPQPPLLQQRYRLQEERHVRVTTEKVFQQSEEELTFFCSSQWQQVTLGQFYPRDGGRYRFRISASAVQSGGESVTYRVIHGRTKLSGKEGLVGYFDAPAGEPAIVEFEQYIEPQTTIAILPYGLATAQAVNKVGADNWDGPGLAVQWVEVEGPLYEDWPPASHRQLFGELPQVPAPIYNQSKRVEVTSDQPLVDAERILRDFMRRAIRRRVTDEDVRPYVAVVEARLAAGASFEQAVRAAFKGVLLSPDFLFLSERPGLLDDFALASRLSYFLWSTMPDEELFALAEAGRLSDPLVLREQVERLLQHPKSAALTENFLGQWLALRDIDFTEPSHILYPEFDHMLKVSMLREAELFFEELLRENLSVSNFVASDFALLNGRLAKHYGLAGPRGWRFERVTLPEGSHRGGVMTMGAVLKVTANGTTTSPVIRGAWVLDRLLGTPSPPPPASVGVIEPDIRGASTIREQLDKHRADPSCSVCHARIDPPGFALESFDCIGGFREHYRVTGNGAEVIVDGRRMAYHRGKPVDPTGITPDGAAFQDVDEFKALLLRDQDQLARAVTVKLLTYATGAAPTASDRPAIDAIVSEVRERDYGLRSLVHAVVQSELFRYK